MSVAIATRGKYVPAGGGGGGGTGEGGGSTPYAYGGGIIPGTVPEKKKFSVSVNYLQVNIAEQEEPKLTISPIKVIQ